MTRHLAKCQVTRDKEVIGPQLQAARRLQCVGRFQTCAGSDRGGQLDDLVAQVDPHDVGALEEGIKGLQHGRVAFAQRMHPTLQPSQTAQGNGHRWLATRKV
jgi:hypothetical protein